MVMEEYNQIGDWDANPIIREDKPRTFITLRIGKAE